MQNDLREALDRLKMAAHVYEDDEMAADCATLEALLSARPLASGGQHSSATDFPPDDVLACVGDTTPARAEAQDEGAAGVVVAIAKVIRDAIEADDNAQAGGTYFEPDSDQMVYRYVDIGTLDLGAIANSIRTIRSAHPSPTPAAPTGAK